MKHSNFARNFILIYLAVFLVAVYGWVQNIVIIATSDFEVTGMLIVRIIGVFVAPLGAVLGYF